MTITPIYFVCCTSCLGSELAGKQYFKTAKLSVVFNFVTSLSADVHLSVSFQLKTNEVAIAK
jgi:hypothetical protein